MVTYITHESNALGVSSASRRLASLMESAGVTFGHKGSFHRVNKYDDFYISALNADLLAFEMATWPKIVRRESYHIGFWSWELENFPRALLPARDLVNEIWTISEHAANGIRGSSDSLVRTVRLPIPHSISTRNQVDSKFTFLTSFDFQSDFVRKNPCATVEAYLKAFPTLGHTRLIIKSVNSRHHSMELAQLQILTQGRPDIVFMDQEISADSYQKLISEADCFVSLHRAEGFGLNLADSMGAGTPVIATGYSGNLEFMDEENSILVPFTMSDVNSYAGFTVKSRWAEPNIDAAADSMMRIANDRKLQQKISALARKRIATTFSMEAAVKNFLGQFCD